VTVPAAAAQTLVVDARRRALTPSAVSELVRVLQYRSRDSFGTLGPLPDRDPPG